MTFVPAIMQTEASLGTEVASIEEISERTMTATLFALRERDAITVG